MGKSTEGIMQGLELQGITIQNTHFKRISIHLPSFSLYTLSIIILPQQKHIVVLPDGNILIYSMITIYIYYSIYTVLKGA